VLCYIGSPIMDLWTLFIAFVGIAALLVQGISCFSKPAVAPAQAPGEAPGQAPNITNTAGSAGRRVIGTLNVILATVATVAVIWLRSGTMVIAPQFGAVMVQGEWNTWMLRAALVACRSEFFSMDAIANIAVLPAKGLRNSGVGANISHQFPR
jgi:hypothetical protein